MVASLPSVPRPPRSDQIVRPAGPTEIPIARLTGAGRDDTSKAGVAVSRSDSRSRAAGTGRTPVAQTLSGAGSSPQGASSVVPGTAPLLSDRLSTMLREYGIPKDAPSLFVLHALMGEGLGLGAETIRAVRAAVLRHAAPRRAALLAARAIAAGLQPDDEGMDALIRSLSGLSADDPGKEPARLAGRQSSRDAGSDPGKDTDREPGQDSGQDSSDRSSSGSDGHGSGQHNSSGQGGQHHPGGHGAGKYECLDEVELQQILEATFLSLSSRAAADPGFASLARRGPDGRGWLCVPYRFSIDTVDFSGYIRIVFNYTASRVERLVAEIDSSGLTRVFDVSWGPMGKPRLRFMPGSLPEGGEFTRIFGASMKVELIPQGEDPALIDTVYRELDGHA